jgi:iron complex outermembrane recepter protein
MMMKENMRRRISCLLLGSLLVMPCSLVSAQEEDSIEIEEITVLGKIFGSGTSRATFELSKEDIEQRPLGAEITQALDKIPGLQVSTGDSRGGSFSFELYLRGLQDQQIGMSIDGIPGGDARFNGGSPPNRYVESSNVGNIEVSQSSGEIGSPSASALGGFIDFRTDDPKDEFGVEMEWGTGDFDYDRIFLRVDSGEILPGLTGYMSYSDQNNEIFTGPNNRDRDREHIELKIKKEFNNGSTVRYRYSYNELEDNDFGIVSLGDFQNDPSSDTVNDFFTGNPSLDGGFTGFGGALGGTREDHFTYFNIDLVINENINVSLNPYYHELAGESFAYQTNASAGSVATDADGNDLDANGNIITDMRVTPRDRQRYGLTGEIKLDNLISNHSIRAGFWVENDKTNEDRNFFAVVNPRTGIAFDRGILNSVGYRRDLETDTRYLYIQDSISLLDDRLNLDIGLTHHDIDYNYGSPLEFAGRNDINAKTNDVDIKLGAVYHFTDDLEGFIGYSQNFGGIFEDAFLGNSNAIDPSTIDAETSENIDVGIRYVTDSFIGDSYALSLQGYFIDFDNRLTTGPTNINANNVAQVINGNSSTQVINQGGVESWGIEFTNSIAWRNFDVYATYSYQQSEWKEDDPTQGIIKGVQVQDIPEHSLFSELAWSPIENARFALNAKYTDSRVGANIFVPGFCNQFFCFDQSGNGVNALENLGTQEIPSYWLLGFRGSYELKDVAGVDIKFQLNVDNLLDEEYIASVTGATNTLPEFGVIGGLTATSALDRYFIGGPRTVTFSVGASY